MTEYWDKRASLKEAIDKNFAAMCETRKNPTSAAYHQLRKQRGQLKKELKQLEDEYWRS